MKFTIEYFTRWGENLILRSASREWPMSYAGEGKWTVEIADKEFFADADSVEYFYELRGIVSVISHLEIFYLL